MTLAEQNRPADTLCDELYEEFKNKAQLLSAAVYRYRSYKEAAQAIGGLVSAQKAQKVAVEPAPMLAPLELKSVLAGKLADLEKGDVRRAAGELDMGVVFFNAAIAETGTLVFDASPLKSRLLSMLPPVCVAVGNTSGLVATFRQAILSYAGKNVSLPSYLALVSGPSRTADIERVLTVGVHGPGELHVIFIDEMGGA